VTEVGGFCTLRIAPEGRAQAARTGSRRRRGRVRLRCGCRRPRLALRREQAAPLRRGQHAAQLYAAVCGWRLRPDGAEQRQHRARHRRSGFRRRSNERPVAARGTPQGVVAGEHQAGTDPVHGRRQQAQTPRLLLTACIRTQYLGLRLLLESAIIGPWVHPNVEASARRHPSKYHV